METMVSAVVWSENQKIRYVHELLLVNPSQEKDHSKLTSVLTVLYEYKHDFSEKAGDDRFDLHFLQRGLVNKLDCLLSGAKRKDDQFYNELINFSHTSQEEPFFVIGDQLSSGYEGAFEGDDLEFHFEKGTLTKLSTTKEYQQKLDDRIPFSVMSLEGKRTLSKKGDLGIARISYEIGTDIEHRDQIGDCAYVDNMIYNIMTPAKVLGHLSGYTDPASSKRKGSEIDKRIRAVIPSKTEANNIIRQFRKDLRNVQRAPFSPKKNENYRFELLIAGMDRNYRYFAGYDSRMTVQNLDNYELSANKNAGQEIVLIGVSPDNSSVNACLPLNIQKMVNLDRCPTVDSLRDEMGSLRTENDGLRSDFKNLENLVSQFVSKA